MAERNPLIVQSDYTLLLEVDTPMYVECRDFLNVFAELVKSPEHMHTYKISPISLWNASSTGISLEFILDGLKKYSRYEIPENISKEIQNQYSRFGILKLHKHPIDDTILILESKDPGVLLELRHRKEIQKYFMAERSSTSVEISLLNRGRIKQLLIETGYPVQDDVGFIEGKPYPLNLLETTKSGIPFHVRDYQKECTDIFYQNGEPSGGHGVIVLPSGSGKTIVGISVMHKIQQQTLVLTTNIAAVHQWINEIKDKTDIPEEDIGEYTGAIKQIKPITVATYQILVSRKSKEAGFEHFSIFYKNPWGLIIYDEVHLLPAPIFRITAEIQAMRRVGLTATLIREDGCEKDVFTLIGPKRYDTPWKVLEKKGWIAQAYCYEIRVPMKKSTRMEYVKATKRGRFRISSENQLKEMVIKELIERYPDRSILIIGQYIGQLERIAKSMQFPIITGKTKNDDRDQIYSDFRKGTINRLVVSKVANFAIDLPDASIAIQISGTFGSRQEEAQRLGRILRPKNLPSYFYSLVSEDTVEQEFALKRQMFLVEQGYEYSIEKWSAEEFGVELNDVQFENSYE